jgi:hypothetical protein
MKTTWNWRITKSLRYLTGKDWFYDGRAGFIISQINVAYNEMIINDKSFKQYEKFFDCNLKVNS